MDSLRAFEAQQKGDRASVEAVMNHLHIADIQQFGCPDISKDKVLLIGTTLKEIYEAKSELPVLHNVAPVDPSERAAFFAARSQGADLSVTRTGA